MLETDWVAKVASTALTDSSGSVTSSATYDSFGNATGNLATRYRFTGREYDDFTGLHYYRARWYVSNLGRFISEDPIGFAGGDVNLYGYVGNGPLNGTDPSGLWDLGCEGIPAGRSPETVLEYLDALDGTINAVESVAGDPIIGVAPIPIYNEGIRLQPITALGVARGFVDMFRVGKGIGAAIFCDDIDGWERAVFILENVTRGANLFATLAGPVAGKGGGGPSRRRVFGLQRTERLSI